MADSLAWIDYNNISHAYDGSSFQLITDEGRANMFMPPIALVDQRTPLYPGTIIRYADVQPRPLVLPVMVNCAGNEVTLRQQLRAMSSYFNPFYSGIWQATAPDGVVRQLFATYQDGMGAVEDQANRWPGSQHLALTFLAADPFWYDLAATVVTPALTQPFFLSNPFLPLKLGGSTILADFTITNTGDWETWPVWTIHGPGSGLVISNLNTNKSFALTANGGLTLGANQILTIDCSFGKKTILTQDGASQAGFLTATSKLFSLQTGANNLAVSMTGQTSQTSVQMTYKQRYFAP